MKKITKIILTVVFTGLCGLSNIANAQSIQGYSDATVDGRGFSYNVQLSFTAMETNNTIHAGGWIVKLVSVNPDSKGYYHKGKTNRYFSCTELGSICDPNKFTDVLVNVNYQCANSESKLIVFKNINQEIKIIVRQEPNTKCSIELESVKVRNNSDESIYLKRINEIEYPQQNTSTTNNNSSSSQSSNNNSSSQSGSTTNSGTTSTNTQQKINQNDPNPMTNGSNGNYQAPKSEYQKNYETGQQIGQLANDVVDIFSKSPERLAREEAERKLKDAEKTEDLESFKKSLSLYIKGASNGNEKDRMRLIDLLIYYNYYKKRDYRAYIPEYKNWLFEAANNKNLIAMNIIGWESINLFGSSGRLDFGLTREQAINILEESADLGSLDAMILLGKYYEWNKCLGNLGGNDPDKALKWFNLAAQNNSPSGYYHLGMIYSYPKGRSCLVNYKMKKNYLLAKEYFLKGTELEESESLTIYNGNPKRSSYCELYFIYNEGKGCDKNPELAKKYLNLFKN